MSLRAGFVTSETAHGVTMLAETDPGLPCATPASLWPLTAIVGALRDIRAHQPASGRVRVTGPLPSRQALHELVEGIKTAFFPAHFGATDLTDESIDYFVGQSLDVSLRILLEQARRGLHLESCIQRPDDPHELPTESAVVRAFASKLPTLRTLLESDIEAAFVGDPAARSLDEILFCYPGINAMIHHRIAHELYLLGVPVLARIISELAHTDTGIDIHPGASIGPGFFIDHGTGVVIGETSVIGARVRLYQGVTLGARRFPTDENGTLIKGLARHPIIEDDVVIYAGATILGRITIGRGSSIGGNVWLTHSVPPDSQISQAQVQQEAFYLGAGI